MEIPKIGSSSSSIPSEKKITTSRKGFSQSFQFANQKKSEQELKKMMDSIKKRGNRLAITKMYSDVRIYKNMIKEYLESVLEHMYGVKKDVSFWQTQYFITVDVVDKKLEELTQMVMSEQKDNLNIAGKIDEISGLIIDIYR